ncbi:heme A synthase [Corynebacterium sp. UMB10119B.1]|uniref:COX15/CtaA family protein n=1 Tax=Corynebacterium sp. UMB10119B.1 TaxID=3050601 RepID=UPI002551582D|nr:COX15/CtaA family protein [Corynebacterium sp. UMB10119B]MDK8363204.1 COX15/CtaA family protein [Corynebacterium sp. UMB10119B]
MTLQQTGAPMTHQDKKQAPSLKLQRTLAMILLLCQGGITVTGSLVRVTGSGLGCNTWPLCHEGSLVPVAGAAPWIHQAIEFGNRLLAFVVAAAAIAVLWAVYRASRGRDAQFLAWFSLVGVVVQAIIGGISVRLDLQWWAVAVHFLPSMVLVWVAALLYMRLAEDESTVAQDRYPGHIRVIAVIAAVALSCVLVTGTMVTGSGPHSGDASVGMEGRLAIDTALLAYIHAGCMYAYLLLTVITFFLLRRAKAPHAAQKTSWILLGLIVVQWAVGLSQYYMGVPRWTIPIHIGLSSLVVAFTAFLYAHAVRRELLYR